MSKVVILGDGLLGSELQKQTKWDFLSRKHHGFDITNPKSFNLLLKTFDGVAQEVKYTTIINCIANTNTYSDNKKEHWDVNYKGVADLVDFCNINNIKLVHISTDYVYTNSTNISSEDSIPIHGNNWYSYSKLLGDSYIELKSNNYLICRGTHKPTPFPYNNAWVDQIGNFDYVDVISNLIVQLINNGCVGVFNVGTDIKTMYNLASQTSTPTPLLSPSNVPHNTSMNLNKLKHALKGNNK